MNSRPIRQGLPWESACSGAVKAFRQCQRRADAVEKLPEEDDLEGLRDGSRQREHSPCGDTGGEHVGVQARAEA